MNDRRRAHCKVSCMNPQPKWMSQRLWNKGSLAWLSAFWDSSQTFLRHCGSWDTRLLLDEWTKSLRVCAKTQDKESDMQNCQSTFDEGKASILFIVTSWKAYSHCRLGQTWKNKFSVKISTETILPALNVMTQLLNTFVCTSVCSTWDHTFGC